MLAIYHILSACGASQPASDLASNYPPDYSWGQRCTGDNLFWICASHSYSDTYLTAYYKGMYKEDRALRAYIKVNGNDGFFQMQHGWHPDPFVKIGEGPLDCRAVQDPTGTRYECDQPTDEMKHVLLYSWDEINRANALDIEIAIENGRGQWDSNWGQNYKYRLEPLP